MTKSTRGRALVLLVGVALALSGLSGCVGDGSSGSGGAGGAESGKLSDQTADKTFTWGYDQELSSYNANTGDRLPTANLVVLGGVLSGFWQSRPDGSIAANGEFGTREKISDHPLTVKYVIDDKAVWSDGEPIECDDLVLTWLANSGATGDSGFSAANIEGYRDMNIPKCEVGDKTVTVVYRKPFAGWDMQFGPASILPAHVLEKRAGLKKSFVDLAATPASPQLAPAIAFYNTGWKLGAGPIDRTIMPSSGPYLLDSWQAGRSVTLKANPRWWGTPPRTGTIVIRYLSASDQVQALRAGTIQAMDPQPEPDTVKQLRQLGGAIKLTTHDQFTFEHLDFNFAGQFKDRTLREAFAKCVPRQRIVDTVVKPDNPSAKVLESRFVFPFQPQYPAFAAAVGGRRYDTVDLAGAKQLLAGRTPTVRIGWRKDLAGVNPRRAGTLALIQTSCAAAGFKVVDAGSATFLDREWPGGQFDVAMLARTGAPRVSASAGVYDTGGAQNRQQYSSPEVDRLMAQALTEIDKAKQFQLLERVDTTLWNDLATIPLFTYPAVLATAKNAQGVEYNPGRAGLTWNVASWTLG